MSDTNSDHDSRADEARRGFMRSAILACAMGASVSRLDNDVKAADEPKAGKAAAPPQFGVHDDHVQWPPGWVGKEEIVIVLFPGFTALDVFGPHHMFVLMMGAKVHLAAATEKPVVSDTGIEVKPTITFDKCPKKPTIILVPGGTAGILEASADPVTLAFVKSMGQVADWVVSVCTGSVLLGAAGLLKGYKATSHWITRDILSEFGAIPVDQRVVVDRNRITGAGVTAGLDLGLQLVRDLRNRQYAEAVQLFAEYDPKPPLDAGSQAKADPQISGLLMQMHEPFREMVRALAKNEKGPK